MDLVGGRSSHLRARRDGAVAEEELRDIRAGRVRRARPAPHPDDTHPGALQNWWGTAANLQDRSLDPLEVAREAFFRRFDFSDLDDTGLELLTLALHDEVQDG